MLLGPLAVACSETAFCHVISVSPALSQVCIILINAKEYIESNISWLLRYVITNKTFIYPIHLCLKHIFLSIWDYWFVTFACIWRWFVSCDKWNATKGEHMMGTGKNFRKVFLNDLRHGFPHLCNRDNYITIAFVWSISIHRGLVYSHRLILIAAWINNQIPIKGFDYFCPFTMFKSWIIDVW